MTAFDFRKSSYSSGSGECVEVAVNVPGAVAVRDSQDSDPEGPILRLAPTVWSSFLAVVQASSR
ncbi:DUF397 domain-containing protein [Streptomyces sp. NPDC059009]|uniref:DUF397 domain-containing protein n=1 Tax=Streptomyces sp. NPDC059009 TaxID=3346694 RepID=UPI0036C6325F